MLADLHDAIAAKFEAGDRFVYLGNVIGGDLSGPSDGCDVRATLAELIRFRAQVLAQPPLYLPDDFVCLRGSQEEMWHKLLQMHFAPKPKELLNWMLGRGVGATLAAYGGDVAQGFGAADEGMLALTRWTGRLKAAVWARPGTSPGSIRSGATPIPGSVVPCSSMPGSTPRAPCTISVTRSGGGRGRSPRRRRPVSPVSPKSCAVSTRRDAAGR
jgi:hypothetical protein